MVCRALGFQQTENIRVLKTQKLRIQSKICLTFDQTITLTYYKKNSSKYKKFSFLIIIFQLHVAEKADLRCTLLVLRGM